MEQTNKGKWWDLLNVLCSWWWIPPAWLAALQKVRVRHHNTPDSREGISCAGRWSQQEKEEFVSLHLAWLSPAQIRFLRFGMICRPLPLLVEQLGQRIVRANSRIPKQVTPHTQNVATLSNGCSDKAPPASCRWSYCAVLLFVVWCTTRVLCRLAFTKSSGITGKASHKL